MTLYFQSHEIAIYRSHHRGNNKYVFSATFTVYNADIQPLLPERAEMYGGRIGKTYQAFVDTTVDIKEGDIVITGGKRYGVKGVSSWQGAGLLDHIELILETTDNA